MAPAPTLIAGGVLYPPSLLWSLPFVPNLLYANVFTMLPSLPASPVVPPTTTLQQDLPEPPDISNPNPLFPVVDVVFTWVDSTDAKWQASYANATGLAFERGVRWTETASPDSELSVAIELVCNNLPWVRQVFVLTARPQAPPQGAPMSCLRHSIPVAVVHHDEVSLGPVFNSFAIETALHRIPNISEHFIYMNDDFYVRAPLTRRHFFTEGSHLPVVRFAEASNTERAREITTICNRSAHIVGGEDGFCLQHGPQAYTKRMLAAAESDPMLSVPWGLTAACVLRYSCGEVEVYGLLAASLLAVRQGLAASAEIQHSSSGPPSPSSEALPHIPKASAARVPPGARSYNDLLVVGPGLPDEAMREEVLRAEVVCIEEPGDASRDDIRRSLRLDDVVRK